MRFKVRGANRETGRDVEIFVEADSEAEAIRKAGDTGIVIEQVDQVSAPPLAEYYTPSPPAPPTTRAAHQAELDARPIESRRILAGIFGVLLGGLGVHKFVLGYTVEGIAYLLLTFVVGPLTCFVGSAVAGLLGLIEGIIYLSKSDHDFVQTYQVGRKSWF